MERFTNNLSNIAKIAKKKLEIFFKKDASFLQMFIN